MSCICIDLYADGGAAAQINLQKKKTGTHLEQPTPADMPEVYYDTDDQEIILVADGYGDSIDVSLLPDDDYKIVITSSYNNVYEGQFTNY